MNNTLQLYTELMQPFTIEMLRRGWMLRTHKSCTRFRLFVTRTHKVGVGISTSGEWYLYLMINNQYDYQTFHFEDGDDTTKLPFTVDYVIDHAIPMDDLDKRIYLNKHY